MRSLRSSMLVTLIVLLVAILLRFWIAPLVEMLPGDYSNDVRLSEDNKFRTSSTNPWQASTLDVRRMDEAVMNTDQALIVEGGLHIYFSNGQPNFESSNLYGVDRITRQNLASYGDSARTGQYLFPTHVQPSKYQIWDPMFIGPRQAVFERVDQLGGIQVYVFSFSATGMDESAGYDYLPEVPEEYLAHTDGQGTIWVEPLSGIVVDYTDSGVSYFVNPANGVRIADFNQWIEAYTTATRTAQINLARNARLRILVLETWLPVGMVLAGIILLTLGIVKNIKLKTERS
jgi:hypothetical protein